MESIKFWKEVKLLFYDKVEGSAKVTLDNGKPILFTDQEVSEKLNTFFQTITTSLEIQENSCILNREGRKS